MSSRTDILRRIRGQTVPPAPLPDLIGAWITYPDRAQQFADVLKFVGGQAVTVEAALLEGDVRQMQCMDGATKIVCTVPGVSVATLELDAVPDPHFLEDVDVAILPGEFAVAENGAVWVTDTLLKHRAIYFIAQHLVLVVPKSQILDNMHQAYERLKFDGPAYGLFMSGPSKTADIEQSLVIGAHGPRSLTVFLVS